MLLAGALALSASAATTQNQVNVQIKNFAYEPAAITIAPGTSVTWTNADDEPHTVTANDKSYKSPALDTDDHFTKIYTAPGEYHYFCSFHPHMTGVVIVRAGGIQTNAVPTAPPVIMHDMAHMKKH